MDTMRHSFGFGWPRRTLSSSRRFADTAYLCQQYRGQCPVFSSTRRSNAYIIHTSPTTVWRMCFSAAMFCVYCGMNG